MSLSSFKSGLAQKAVVAGGIAATGLSAPVTLANVSVPHAQDNKSHAIVAHGQRGAHEAFHQHVKDPIHVIAMKGSNLGPLGLAGVAMDAMMNCANTQFSCSGKDMSSWMPAYASAANPIPGYGKVTVNAGQTPVNG